MREKGKIVLQGMGGFLCPPGHPMRTHSVQTDLRRRPANRGGMALDYAVDSPLLDDATRAAARTVLAAWKKPPLDAPEVQAWILEVLGYYRGCYNFDGLETGWHVENLTIDFEIDALENANYHAGVHLIREYYPDYQPTREHFAHAHWGEEPA